MDHLPASRSTRGGRLNTTSATALLNAWSASGLSAPRFARQQGIPAQTLYRWRDRLRRRATSADLCAVVLDPSRRSDTPAASIVVELPSGIRVHVAPTTDEGHLRRVLRAVTC